MHVLYSYFLYCFSIVFLKQERKGESGKRGHPLKEEYC